MNAYDSAGTQLFRYSGGPTIFIDGYINELLHVMVV